MNTAPPAPLTIEQRLALLQQARQVRIHAHAPYSRVTVGAALLTTGGAVYPGCNVEMAADYGTCAEGVAVANALTQGALAEGQGFIRAIAITMDSVAARSPDGMEQTSPCGICRQVLHDFAENGECWLVLDDRGEGVMARLSDLLPHAFRLGTPPALVYPEDCAALEREAAGDPSPETLARIARTISRHAAAHTRHMPEGAVAVTADGRAFCGVSVENSNANHYVRAAATACNRAVLNGAVPRFLTALAVAIPARTTAEDDLRTAVSSALLSEFALEGVRVTVARADDAPVTWP